MAKIPVHHPLRVGSAVSLEAPSRESVAALVTELSPAALALELVARPREQLYSLEEPVRIVFWERETTYFWNAVVSATAGPAQVSASIQDIPVTIQRRKVPRYQLAVPFSFTVVQASLQHLEGSRIRGCQTSDISVNGMGFETDALLNVGDKLAVDLRLNQDEGIRVLACVVRTERREQNGRRVTFVGAEFSADDEAQMKLNQFLALSQLGGRSPV